MAKTHNTTTAATGNIAPFGLRMLPDLREQIEAAAKASGRSMNAEIIARLQQSFDTKPTLFADASNLKNLAEAHKSTADALGQLCTTLAKFILAASKLLTEQQLKKAPQVEIWVSIASGIVVGKGTEIQRMLDSFDSPSESKPRQTAMPLVGTVGDVALINPEMAAIERLRVPVRDAALIKSQSLKK